MKEIWSLGPPATKAAHDLFYPLEALERRVEQLGRTNHTILYLELNVVAIRFYARQNLICHGRIFDPYASNILAGLAEYIEMDDKSLEETLADEEKSQVDKYRRLFKFYRLTHICKDDENKWI